VEDVGDFMHVLRRRARRPWPRRHRLKGATRHGASGAAADADLDRLLRLFLAEVEVLVVEAEVGEGRDRLHAGSIAPSGPSARG
jgi:hypothetical protein